MVPLLCLHIHMSNPKFQTVHQNSLGTLIYTGEAAYVLPHRQRTYWACLLQSELPAKKLPLLRPNTLAYGDKLLTSTGSGLKQ